MRVPGEADGATGTLAEGYRANRGNDGALARAERDPRRLAWPTNGPQPRGRAAADSARVDFGLDVTRSIATFFES